MTMTVKEAVPKAAFGPYVSLQQHLEAMAWREFYKRISSGERSALDKVIDTIQTMFDSARENLLSENERKSMDGLESERGYVTHIDIGVHFGEYLQYKSSEIADDLETRERIQWNYANDILRCLKGVKNNYSFILPKKDREITSEFVGRLSHPPQPVVFY